jgi:hypothetical protein
MTVRVTNAGPEADTVHVLPSMWFRNTWAWDVDVEAPLLAAVRDDAVRVPHPFLGELELHSGPASDGARPTLLFCDNDTNARRLFGSEPITPWPKDGINDHVITGAPTVNPARQGSRCAAWYRTTVAPGATVEIRLRLRPAGGPDPAVALGADFERVVAERRDEADEFYAELTPDAASADEAAVMRQAFAGMLWCKQSTRTTWPLAGRRSRPAAAAGAQIGSQRAVAHVRGVRHHVDAGHLGVPVVRGVGPRVPLRGARPRRPCLREVSAVAAVP